MAALLLWCPGGLLPLRTNSASPRGQAAVLLALADQPWIAADHPSLHRWCPHHLGRLTPSIHAHGEQRHIHDGARSTSMVPSHDGSYAPAATTTCRHLAWIRRPLHPEGIGGSPSTHCSRFLSRFISGLITWDIDQLLHFVQSKDGKGQQ